MPDPAPRAATAATSPRPRPAARAALRLLGRLFARPTSAVGTSIVLLVLALALVGPLVAPYGPTSQDLAARSLAPSPAHPFGTDWLGRDVFSRVVAGARDLVLLAGGGTVVAVVLGALIGMLATWSGGWREEAVFRLFDALLALPALLLALLLLGTLGRGRLSVALVIAVAYTPIVARVARSVVLSVKRRDYVSAARLQGERTGSLLARQILPSVLPALAVEGALRFSYAIFLVASLGFLGVGVQPPSPDWGLMVSEARDRVYEAPWALWAPAAAIAATVVGVNLAADGLQRALHGGAP